MLPLSLPPDPPESGGRKPGTFSCERPEPWLVSGRISGHYAESMVGPYLAEMSRTLGQGRKVVGFHDWSEMTSYDTPCRLKMTDWVMRHRAQTERHYILLTSKLVAMGVATANLLIGGGLLVAFTDPAELRAAERKVRSAR